MTSFTIAAAVVTFVALGILILPLLRTRNTVSYERQAQNIHYAKERLEELEEQLKNASISATDYEALKLEIESTLAHDIDIVNNSDIEQTPGPRRSNKLIIGLISVFLPLSGLGFYLILGTPEAINLVAPQNQATQEQVQDLVADVEKRLEENPDDLEGWQMLSQTYLALGRYEEAKQGYQRVLTLGGETAHAYASLADATALAAGGQITQEASKYIQRALLINRDNRQALWLAGLAGAQSSDKATAKKHWGRLVPLLADAPQQQQELRDIILNNLGEEPFENLAAQETPTTQEPLTSKKQTTSAVASQSGLTVKVRLGSELAQLADSNDFVFIFARALQGPPAPLAVKRLRVADLPVTITLDDSDAMVAPMTLSKFEDVVVSARVSKSGQPVAQAGDLQSDVIPTKNTASEPIELTISNIVK